MFSKTTFIKSVVFLSLAAAGVASAAFLRPVAKSGDATSCCTKVCDTCCSSGCSACCSGGTCSKGLSCCK